MGCWNETCGITQMPIHTGDPVVLMFLTKVDSSTENHNGFCHANHVWTPKFLPVFGKYDDYGGLEDIEENWNTQYIVEQLTSELMQVRLSTPAAHTDTDPDDLHAEHDELDLGAFTVYDVLDEIRQDRLWVPGVKGFLPVGWCMIHRWVWDHMTQIMDRDWQENLTLSTVVAHGEAYYTAMQARGAELESEPNQSALNLLLMYGRKSLVDWQNAFAVLSENSARLDSYHTLTGIRSYDEVLWKLATAHTPVQDDHVQEVIRSLSEFLVFKNNMMVLRKFWSPQSGKGSQISAQEAHLALHELCATKLKEHIRQWAEEQAD